MVRNEDTTEDALFESEYANIYTPGKEEDNEDNMSSMEHGLQIPNSEMDRTVAHCDIYGLSCQSIRIAPSLKQSPLQTLTGSATPSQSE